jgi:hypothetical protein
VTEPFRGSGEQPAVPAPPAKKRRRRWPWVLGGVVLLLIVIISNENKNSSPSAPAAAALPAAGATGLPSAPATQARQSAPPTQQAPESAPPTQQYLPAEAHSGRGDDVVTTNWGAHPGYVRFECPACTGNTVVQTDGDESLLVNTIGAYKGTKWINIKDGTSTRTLTVKATGRWTLTISDADKLPSYDAAAPASGSGDAVVVFHGSVSKAKITNSGAGNFAVEVVSNSGMDLAVNEIGNYDGTVPLTGPAIVQVTSDGKWTIAPS